MLLNEPSRTPYDLHFSLFGIPVRVHPMFWLVTVILGAGGEGRPLPMLIWVGAVFVSILVHEMGHALVARAYGCEPWITLMGFGGLASYQPKRRTPSGEIAITLAGPLAGFLFALVLLAAIHISGHHVEFGWHRSLLPFQIPEFRNENLNRLLDDLLFINILWGLVNLLPVYPLDGGQISRNVLGLLAPGDGLRLSLWVSVIVAVAVAVWSYSRLHSIYTSLFFAYLAYTSFAALQSLFGSDGGFGGRR